MPTKFTALSRFRLQRQQRAGLSVAAPVPFRRSRRLPLQLGLATVLLIIAGCASNAERAAEVSAEIDRMIEIYGPACEKLGYPRDGDSWRDCVLQLAARSDLRFHRSPTTTTCIGHRGFFHCSQF